ncbi:MAG: aminoglycoside phosphotransferase family protein [Clostridiales bacterium]|jgi:Ser/Thr protein kinase RdoA (MazF antagonist)|nr:aminoglycoside phosphotransferase family protein [Clostridiales bacterium]
MFERDKITDENIKRILESFNFEGSFVGLAPHGCGHINDTFLMSFSGADGGDIKYILQRINGGIFKNIPALMRNFELVTAYLAEKSLKAGGNPMRDVLTLIFTRSGQSYLETNGEYFRAFVFIDRAISYQTVEKPEHFFEAGIAFGRFAALLDGFDASLLFEAIPNFHDTAKRYDNFLKALEADKHSRAKDVKAEIEFTKSRRGITNAVISLLNDNKIPKRVTHNDTKLNNVMIDDVTGKAVAVIDLDTVMPGSLLYDFGDSIRSGCNTAAEDEKDLSKVTFDLKLFAAYSKGYIKETKKLIRAEEKKLLAAAPVLMTFECGMRFLTDYLDGDNYFKIKYPSHNLDRARTQYKLVADMEKNADKMAEILDSAFAE